MNSSATADTPRIFVSHSHEDAAFCRAYVNGLRAHGFDVWYDEHNLGSGALRQVIEREMRDREHFVVILSRAAVDSDWVQREIDAALFLYGEKRVRTFLPVVASACEIPLLVQGYKRIEGLAGAAVDVEEAIARTVQAIQDQDSLHSSVSASRRARADRPSARPAETGSARAGLGGLSMPGPRTEWKLPRRPVVSDEVVAMGVLSFLVMFALSIGLVMLLRQSPAPQAQVLGALGIAGVCLLVARGVQRHPALRNPILVFSQTRSAHLLFTIAAGILVGSVASTAGWRVDTAVAGVPYQGVVTILACGVSLLTWMTVAILDRMKVSAAQCYEVLKRIEWQRAAGDRWYAFPVEMEAPEIRHQGRILDLLTVQRQSPLARHFGRYEIRPHKGEAQSESWIATDPPSDSAERYEAYVMRLSDEAHRLWRFGARRLAWRAVGGAVLPVSQARYEPIFGNRLDQLFNGGEGYRVGGPGGARFTTILFHGSRGAGKSTAALQLSVYLARQGRICVYVSLEDEREEIFQSARAFGWDKPTVLESANRQIEYRGVLAAEARSIANSLEPRSVSAKLGERFTGGVLVTSFDRYLLNAYARLASLVGGWAHLPGLPPRCVVLDNLESLLNAGLDRVGLEQIKDFFRDRCDMLVLLADAEGNGALGYLEGAADTVIHFGRRDDAGAPPFYVQIQLARGQSYSTSKHQVRVRSLADVQVATGAIAERQTVNVPGLHILPALEDVRFSAWSRPVFEDFHVSSGLRGLDEMLESDRARGQGLRANSALALLGPGGTGKSLIGMNFAIEGARENRSALLLSLRDDEETIKGRAVPQEHGRMRLSWAQAPDGSWFHQIEWALDGLAQWVGNARWSESSRAPELPYLFPSYTDELSAAVGQFLRAVASVVPPGDPPIQWAAGARRYAQEACDEAWYRLVLEVGDRLVTVVDRDRLGHLRPQQITLQNVEGGADELPPALVWSSPAHETAAGVVYDTRLLEVKSWRPGSISPEDFVERLLKIIGPADGAQRYGRVVIDDLSYLRRRFPLLAAASNFLPTLIDLFKARGMASLFVGGVDPGSAQVDYGLEALADEVIRTHFKYLRTAEVSATIGGELPRPGVRFGPVVEDTGDHRDRIVTVEVDGRPGPPHQLWLSPPYAGPRELELRPVR